MQTERETFPRIRNFAQQVLDVDNLFDVIGSQAIRRLDRFSILCRLEVRGAAVLPQLDDNGVICAEVDVCPECFPQAFSVSRVRLEDGDDQLGMGTLDRVLALILVARADPAPQQAEDLIGYVAHQRIEKPLIALGSDALNGCHNVFMTEAVKPAGCRDPPPSVEGRNARAVLLSSWRCFSCHSLKGAVQRLGPPGVSDGNRKNPEVVLGPTAACSILRNFYHDL